MDGTFMDSSGPVLTKLLDLGTVNAWIALATFLVFILLSAFTVMNMLIGVLCEVVCAVGQNERDDAEIRMIKESILVALKKFDDDGNNMVSRTELQHVMGDAQSLATLQSLDVDVLYLLELQNMMFPHEDSQIPMKAVMELILMCRGHLPTTVKHMAHWQALTRWTFSAILNQHEQRVLAHMNGLLTVRSAAPNAQPASQYTACCGLGRTRRKPTE